MSTNYVIKPDGTIMAITPNDNTALEMMEPHWVLYCPGALGYSYFTVDLSSQNFGNVKPLTIEEVPELVRMTILLADL